MASTTATTITNTPATASKDDVVYYLLTGDIGGTNSRLSLYDTVSTEPLVQKVYRNSEHLPTTDTTTTLSTDTTVFAKHILQPFLRYCFEEKNVSSCNVKILATLAIAGTVANNRVNLTNLGNILVDGNAIVSSEECQQIPYLSNIIKCKIINDFVAQGYGCLTLTKKDVKHLYGPSDMDHLPIGPKVCIGAGTGLGECYLTPCSDDSNDTASSNSSHMNYICFPSEGGHVEYAPRNDIEIEMLQYLSEKFESKQRISIERVVSGIGLANVYEFLTTKYPKKIDPVTHTTFLKAGDEQGRIVAEHSNVPESLCQQAMEIMMSAYGCEAGSCAIKWIPTGGLFLTGGLTPKNIDHIVGMETSFMKSYLHKGRVSPLLERIPCFAVVSDDLGIRGVHKAAQREFYNYKQQHHG